MKLFKDEWFKESDYPTDFIPNGAEIFVGIDYASPDSDCTVKGFYIDGEFHIQEIDYGENTSIQD
jgi:hypothetical protein